VMGVEVRFVEDRSSVGEGRVSSAVLDRLLVVVSVDGEVRVCVEVTPTGYGHKFFVYGIDREGKPFMFAGYSNAEYWEVYEIEKSRKDINALLNGRYPFADRITKRYRPRLETVKAKLSSIEVESNAY